MSTFAPDQQAACATCAAPLADDQRYCLACGSRTIEPHIPPPRATPPTPPPDAPTAAPAERDPTPLLALGVLGALALVLVVGVLIGRGGDHGTPQAAAPQIVTVGGGAASGAASGGSSSNASNTGGAVKSEWPDKNGWTVELGTVSKSGATAASVGKAKADATGKGAKDVGVLDSDKYGSLPGGDYVVYSGVYGSKAKASAALKKLKGKFPDATVVKVSAGGGAGAGAGAGAGGGGGGGGGGNAAPADVAPPGTKAVSGAAAKKAVQDLNQSGAAYEKTQKKPKTIALPGKPPPPDHKAAGAGGKAQTFG